MPWTRCSGKGAVITGGASGIGLATAEVLAAKGAKLVLADVEEGALDVAVQRLRDGGADAHGVVCDVRSLDAVKALADAAFSAVGGVHVVFNNAGIAVGGPVLAMTHDDWRWTIDVDLWGPIHGVEAFLPRIVEQGEGGHILFTASFAGLVPNSGLGPYCVAKYGVVALAEVLWRELREHQIGVSVLCPMRVGTNIGAVRAQPPGGLRRDRAGRPASPIRAPATTTSPDACSHVDGRRRADGRRHRAEPPVRAPARGEPGVDPPPLRPHRPDVRRAADAASGPSTSASSLASCFTWASASPASGATATVRRLDAVGRLASGRRQLEDAEALVALRRAPPHEVALGELRRQHREPRLGQAERLGDRALRLRLAHGEQERRRRTARGPRARRPRRGRR